MKADALPQSAIMKGPHGRCFVDARKGQQTKSTGGQHHHDETAKRIQRDESSRLVG